jgi:copper transport protein
MHRLFSFSAALLTALIAAAAVAGMAFAHAQLLSSKPKDGEALKQSPREFVLTFDEGIETDFVQLRVEDAAGQSADQGEPYHPQGREELVAIRLRSALEGTYVASYRVISEDGHPVEKSTEFTVRPPSPAGGGDQDEMPSGGAGAAMPPSEEHLDSVGPVTDTAFAAVRGLGYLAIALAVGGAVFLAVVWVPALARHAHGGADWRAASETFVGRVRRIVIGAVVLGLVATALAIVLEGATAAGVSFWRAFDSDVLDSVADTGVVEAWMLRLVIWVVLGVLLLSALGARRAPVLRRAALGAEGAIVGPPLSRPQGILIAAAVIALALTAPMAGHTGDHSPEALLVCCDAAHVLCMSVWLGGLVLLLAAVPVATRVLSPGQRTPLLAGVVGRFSRMALIAVAVLALTGVIQSLSLVASFGALIDTAYGRLVLAKIVLLGGLVALGAYNQRRSLPRLRRLAAGGEEPGRAGAMLHRAVAWEVAFILVVLGVTSVLVATTPAVSD